MAPGLARFVLEWERLRRVNLVTSPGSGRSGKQRGGGSNLSGIHRMTNIVTSSESEVAQSCPTLCDPMDSSLHQAPPSMGFF